MILLFQDSWVRATDLTTAKLKPYVGLVSTETSLDTQLTLALDAAARMFEKRTGRLCAAQTIRQKHDITTIFAHRGMRLVLGPVDSVTSVTEVDKDGNATALASTKWYYDEFLQSVVFTDGVDDTFSDDVIGAELEASITQGQDGNLVFDKETELAIYALAAKWVTDTVDVDAIIGAGRFQSASLMSAM